VNGKQRWAIEKDQDARVLEKNLEMEIKKDLMEVECGNWNLEMEIENEIALEMEMKSKLLWKWK